MSAERENAEAAEAVGEQVEGEVDAAAGERSGDAAGTPGPEAAHRAPAEGGSAADSAQEAPDQGEGDEAVEDAPSEEDLAAARELAEHNALADVFDDVRKQSADSHLVTPDRWPEVGLVPDHMTAEDFEMFVYEWLEGYQTEHKDEIEAERAAERAKAASVRSSVRTGVGCPPKIPNRRLAQIEADKKAQEAERAEQAAEQEERAATAEGASEAQQDGASALSPASPAAAASASLSERARKTGAGAAGEDSAGSPASATAGGAMPAAGEGHESAASSLATASPSADASHPEGVSGGSAPDSAAGSDDDDQSPFAGLRIPEGYKLEQIEGQWTLVPDEDAAPMRKEIKCNRIKALMGMHSYYLYDETLMTDSYAHWAFLAAEDNPVVTFVECVREDARVYPRPYPAVCLKNPPFRMTDEQIEQTWQAVRDSGNYPDIERTQASNGDVYYYSTKYLAPEYAASLAEYDAVERPADV